MEPRRRNQERGVQVDRQIPEDQDRILEELLVDGNNNLPQAIQNPEVDNVGFPSLPPVSTAIALMQVVCYCAREYLSIYSEEDVYVSWKNVVVDGQYWRMLYAQYFHFSRVHVFLNVCALVSIGRYLENKLRKLPLIILIQFMGVTSNTAYICLSSYLCPGLKNQFSYGFTNIIFALRIIRIFLMDTSPSTNNGRREPSLMWGFFPIYLPLWLTPWQPLFETMVFEVIILDRCIASNISGAVAAILFPHFVEHFKAWILLPTPPAPRTTRSRHTLVSITRRNLQENNNNAEEENTGHMEGVVARQGEAEPIEDDESTDDDTDSSYIEIDP